MNMFNKCFFLVLLLTLTLILLPQQTHGWWWQSGSDQGQKPRAHRQEYDFNNDGRIDVKDTLIWLEKNRGVQKYPVYVSKENKGLFDVMDMDSDGDVEQWEMEAFYGRYDLDKNGVLEKDEIGKALIED